MNAGLGTFIPHLLIFFGGACTALYFLIAHFNIKELQNMMNTPSVHVPKMYIIRNKRKRRIDIFMAILDAVITICSICSVFIVGDYRYVLGIMLVAFGCNAILPDMVFGTYFNSKDLIFMHKSNDKKE